MITAYPVKRFVLDVRMFSIKRKKMLRVFTESVTTAYNRIFFLNLIRYFATVFKFPWHHVGGRIIFDVYHIPSSFEHKCFETFFTKFFCGPSAAHARSNDDSIKGAVLF